MVRQRREQQSKPQSQAQSAAETQMSKAQGNRPFRLTTSRKDAARELQAAGKIGQAIRGQRIRDMRDLDEARREKQEWVQRTMEVLARLVNAQDWCEQFNDFVPTILPEYAEFGMFVDVFEEEMRHRLGRLNGFFNVLANIPEPPPLQQDPADHPPHPELAEVLDQAIGAQPDAALIDDGDGGDEDDEGGNYDNNDEDEDDDATEAQSASRQLETLYVPPEAKKMPQQQQQQQLQQQQQQQTVAASILLEPNESSRGSGAAAGSQTRGALIIRTNDEPAAQATAEFMEKLGLALRVIDRRNPNGHSMMDELNSQSGARFVLMLVDAHNASNSAPDDLFDLGCCVGRMGPERVFALHRGGENAVDRFGIAHVPLDETEGWQLQLARLLRKAGVSVDLNKLV